VILYLFLIYRCLLHQERARAEDTENWSFYQDISWEYQVDDQLSWRKRKIKEKPDGYDKEPPEQQYYPPTNIVPFPIPPPVLPLHIPIHQFLTKGFT
jgi:hypothetical protein